MTFFLRGDHTGPKPWKKCKSLHCEKLLPSNTGHTWCWECRGSYQWKRRPTAAEDNAILDRVVYLLSGEGNLTAWIDKLPSLNLYRKIESFRKYRVKLSEAELRICAQTLIHQAGYEEHVKSKRA